jgi:peptidylprolyl isomerase/peptidyl-prolyl cis-trans isomerase B (cyclophilin B)
MKKHLLLVSLITILVFGCNKQKESTSPVANTAESCLNPVTLQAADQLSAERAILKTIHGNITLKFYAQKAPGTVKRIQELISKSFYDGLAFHRVIPGFVAQGGDPSGNGSGGSGVNLKAEFNDLKHLPGVVAMARSNEPDSADSQFYITYGTPSHLDNNYTIFAQVIDCMDVALKIQQGDKIIGLSLLTE